MEKKEKKIGIVQPFFVSTSDALYSYFESTFGQIRIAKCLESVECEFLHV